MKSFWKDFKAFISKGNIVDLAVAVVIGNAFNKIVSALVNNIIMPLVGVLIGGLNVSDWKWVLKEAVFNEAGEEITAENAVLYGVFIQSIIDFLLVALCIFIALRIMMKVKETMRADEIAAEKAKAEEEAAAKKAETEAAEKAAADEAARRKAEDEEKLRLLREIRDSLRK